MKTVKVSEVSGAALDWLVAKCEGDWILSLDSFVPHHNLGRMNFCNDWAQGGPIIDREGICIQLTGDAEKWRGHVWDHVSLDFTPIVYGSTALIAAMRCYVANKMGEYIEVPEELLLS